MPTPHALATCLLICLVPPAVAAEPTTTAIDLDVIGVLHRGSSSEILIVRGGGNRGLAVGDEVRLPCADGIGKVREVYPFRAKLEVPPRIGKQGSYHTIRVTLGGARSEPWCPDAFVKLVRTLPTYVQRVAPHAEHWELQLSWGARAGVAVGDELRFACIDDDRVVARVVRVDDDNAWAHLPRVTVADPCQLTRAQITLDGKSSRAYCPRPDPDAVAPRRLEARVIRAERDGNWINYEIDRGRADGVAFGMTAERPCDDVSALVFDVDEHVTRFRVNTGRWPTPPARLWVNLNDTQRQGFCFHDATTCPAQPEAVQPDLVPPEPAP